jgi:hypothetical protein
MTSCGLFKTAAIRVRSNTRESSSRSHIERPYSTSRSAKWLPRSGCYGGSRCGWMRTFSPDGYNVGWNGGRVGGKEIIHAHLHVIPRFRQEPLTG